MEVDEDDIEVVVAEGSKSATRGRTVSPGPPAPAPPAQQQPPVAAPPPSLFLNVRYPLDLPGRAGGGSAAPSFSAQLEVPSHGALPEAIRALATSFSLPGQVKNAAICEFVLQVGWQVHVPLHAPRVRAHLTRQAEESLGKHLKGKSDNLNKLREGAAKAQALVQALSDYFGPPILLEFPPGGMIGANNGKWPSGNALQGRLPGSPTPPLLPCAQTGCWARHSSPPTGTWTSR